MPGKKKNVQGVNKVTDFG